MVGSSENCCNHLGKDEHGPHLEFVLPVCQHTWVRHSGKLLVGSIHSWNALHYCGELIGYFFHNFEDETYCLDGGPLMKHMVVCTHHHGNPDQWNLNIEGDLEEGDLFLVAAVYYIPAHDIYHFGRKEVAGDMEARDKIVVGHASDCHNHYDRLSLVSY